MWKSLSQGLGAVVLHTGSGPLTVALRKVFRFRRRWITTPQGRFLVDPFSYFGFHLVRNGIYEPDLLRFLETHLEPGDVVVDAGAHEGYFGTVAAQIVGPTGRVVAIEPQSRVRPILQRNIEANGLTNVTVAPCAVSDVQGTAQMHLDMGWNTGGTSIIKQSRFRLPTELVATRRLVDILDEAGVDQVALIKSDIEGFEYEMILGSPELFRDRRVRTLALELHGNHLRARGRNPDDINDFLLDCGYVLDRAESSNLGSHYATMIYVLPPSTGSDQRITAATCAGADTARPRLARHSSRAGRTAAGAASPIEEETSR
ncbi:FkbM family methyltransferase [Actinoplanes sp. NPDC024001]|uniref:FkbM family methyltransferase n=1 Tax=Actinoplanes sp. NPDC024001 TaxID=3154598 RepID=UPI0033F2F73F